MCCYLNFQFQGQRVNFPITFWNCNPKLRAVKIRLNKDKIVCLIICNKSLIATTLFTVPLHFHFIVSRQVLDTYKIEIIEKQIDIHFHICRNSCLQWKGNTISVQVRKADGEWSYCSNHSWVRRHTKWVVSSGFYTLREIFIRRYELFNKTTKDQSNPELPPKRRYWSPRLNCIKS